MHRMLRYGVIGDRHPEGALLALRFGLIQQILGYIAKTSQGSKLRFHDPLGHLDNLRVLLPDLKNTIARNVFFTGYGNGRVYPAAFIKGVNFFRIIKILAGVSVTGCFFYFFCYFGRLGRIHLSDAAF